MYNKAVESMNKGEYNQVVEYLQDIGDFKDSIELLEVAKLEQKYKEAKELFDDRKFEQAEKRFNELDEFKDSHMYAAKALLPEMNKMKKELYTDACEKYEDGTVVGEGHDLGDGQLNVSDWKNIMIYEEWKN